MGELDFQIREVPLEPEGLQLVISGEPDLAVVDHLRQRFESLSPTSTVIVLDVSELSFIDSSGLSRLVEYFKTSSRDGWQLSLAPETTSAVHRMLALTGLDQVFWP